MAVENAIEQPSWPTAGLPEENGLVLVRGQFVKFIVLRLQLLDLRRCSCVAEGKSLVQREEVVH